MSERAGATLLPARWHPLGPGSPSPGSTIGPDQDSGRPPDSRSSPASLVAIALVSATVLLYEIAVTRVLSTVVWYHSAFLSISVAMLGIGAPGVWFALRRPSTDALPRLLVVAALLVPLSIVGLVKGRPLVDPGQERLGLWLTFVILCLLGAMLSLGSSVCLLLLSAPGRSIGRMYGADLLGAMVGAAASAPLLYWAPTPALIAGCGLLPAAAALLVRPGRPAAPVLAATAVLAVIAWGEPLHLRYSKLYAEEGPLAPLHELWTPTARICVLATNPYKKWSAEIPWAWGFGSRYQPTSVRELWIDQDGCAGTPIENLTGDPSALTHLAFDVTSVGYQVFAPRDVCVIGAGGGRDIASALSLGATRIDAVELNAAIVELMSGPLREFSGAIYHRPGVAAQVSEGRNFLERTDRRYDLLQISLVDTWAATSAGAYALSENYLYTVEAFRLYWERLNDGGVLSISRWTDLRRPVEGARLVLLAEAALESLGVPEPRRHLLFVTGGGGAVGTLLVTRRPVDNHVLARLEEVDRTRGFERLWPEDASAAKASFVHRILTQGSGSLDATGFDLSPPTDDRPFFFQSARILGARDDASGVESDENVRAVAVLRTVVLVLTGLAVVLFLAPFALGKSRSRSPGFWPGSAYFALIGIAFMLVELPWIQRSILYVGHPTYAASTVLASLLLGAGLGSAASTRASRTVTNRVLLLTPLVVGLVNGILNEVFHATMGLELWQRIVVCSALFVPSGFCAGFWFPVGMVRFTDRHKAWFWAVNGVFGVAASAVSLASAMLIGFRATGIIGACAYLVAAVFALRAGSADAPAAPVGAPA